MSTSRSSRKSRGDEVHPESTPQLGKFMRGRNSSKRKTSSKESDQTKSDSGDCNSLVASMILAFDTKSEPRGKESRPGDAKTAKHVLPVKKVASSGAAVGLGSSRGHTGTRNTSGVRSGNKPEKASQSLVNGRDPKGIVSSGKHVAEDGDTSTDDSYSSSSSSDSEDDDIETRKAASTGRRTRVTRSLGRNVRNVTGTKLGGKPTYHLRENAPRLHGKVVAVPPEAKKGTKVDARAQKAVNLLRSSEKTGREQSLVSQSKGAVVKPLGVATAAKSPVVCPSRGASGKSGPSQQKLVVDSESSNSSSSSLGRKLSESSKVDATPARLKVDATSARSKVDATPASDTPERSPSPGKRRSRIESNPFFQKDQLNRSGGGLQALRDLNRERIGSAPPPVSGSEKTLPDATTATVRETRSETPFDKGGNVEEETSGEPPRRCSSGTMSIRDRIKLWADKEREIKEAKEKQTSPRTSPKHTPTLRRAAKSERDVTAEGKRDGQAKRIKSSVSSSALPPSKPDEVEEFYDDVVTQSQRLVQGEEGEEEYEDVVRRTQRKQSDHHIEEYYDSDEYYDDVNQTSRQQRTKSAPPPSLNAIQSLDNDDVYAEIPGTKVYQNISIGYDTPPKLPPRPKSMKSNARVAPQAANAHGMEEELYEDIEHSPGSITRFLTNMSSPSKKGQGKKNNEETKSKSKWNFRSPRLGRKKKNKEGLERQTAVDDGCEKELNSPTQGAIRVAGRNTGKRKALKRRSSEEPGSQPEEEEQNRVLQENGFDRFDQDNGGLSEGAQQSFEQDNLIPPRRQRSTSSPLPVNGVNSPADADEDPASYTVVQRRQLDHSGEIVPVIKVPVSSEPPPVPAHKSGSRFAVLSKEQRKNQTLSREIYSIIDGLGSQGDSFEPIEEEMLTAEDSERLLSSAFLSTPSSLRPSRSDPALNIHSLSVDNHLDVTSRSERGSPCGFHNGISYIISGDSSSESPASARNSLEFDDASPNLDHITAQRLEIKRRQRHASSGGVQGKTVMNEKYLSGGHKRKESITSLEDGVITTSLMYADAVWDRVAIGSSDELSFRAGDVIEILDMTDDVWWHGSVGECSGWFLASFARLRVGQDSGSDVEDEDKTKTPDSETRGSESVAPEQPGISRLRQSTIRRRMTIRRKDTAPPQPKKLSPAEVRAKVVEEILNTERDYVRHLGDIVEGYLTRCREYNSLFDDDRVETIFCNIEQIYHFQQDFLCELEARIDHTTMEQSQIGEVFILNQHEFSIYSDYCNNHPHAVNEMNALQQIDQYALFFESCRLLRNLEDIALEGFLLTPVQKICKYPLQLSELLKYTGEDHPDHAHMLAAVKAMKEVATLINEQKRRMENIGKIGHWQESIENWKGKDILETSTELIHSGELHKISKGHSQERHFFLFDHQLIYCKKESIIGGKLVYKGRVDIDNCETSDLPDGAAFHGGNPVRNAWKMHNEAKDKWYVIFAKTAEVKAEWMEAFQRERERVREDEEKHFNVTLRMKRAAVALAGVRVERRKRRKSFSKKHALSTDSTDSGLRHRVDNGGRKLVASAGGQASPRKVRGHNNKRARTPGASPNLVRRL